MESTVTSLSRFGQQAYRSATPGNVPNHRRMSPPMAGLEMYCGCLGDGMMSRISERLPGNHGNPHAMHTPQPGLASTLQNPAAHATHGTHTTHTIHTANIVSIFGSPSADMSQASRLYPAHTSSHTDLPQTPHLYPSHAHSHKQMSLGGYSESMLEQLGSAHLDTHSHVTAVTSQLGGGGGAEPSPQTGSGEAQLFGMASTPPHNHVMTSQLYHHMYTSSPPPTPHVSMATVNHRPVLSTATPLSHDMLSPSVSISTTTGLDCANSLNNNHLAMSLNLNNNSLNSVHSAHHGMHHLHHPQHSINQLSPSQSEAVVPSLTPGGGGLSESDPRELEAFAEHFKQRRIKLGVTQADVGTALGKLKIPGVGSLSQSTICRFESLTLSHNNMIALKPVLQTWLENAEAAARQSRAQAEAAFNLADKKRKRTSIAAPEKRSLEAYFTIQPRPTGEKIAQIAEKLDLKKNVVRVWFCNQRQKQKRMKFSATVQGQHSPMPCH